MPIFIDVADGSDLNEKVRSVLDSTLIRLNGKGNLMLVIDYNNI